MFKKIFNNWHIVLVIYLTIIILSSMLFSIFEGRSLLDCIWWAFITATTIGYGDIYPLTLGGRIITILLSHVSVFLVVPAIVSHLLSKLIENKNEFTDQEQEAIKNILSEIKNKL